MNADVRIDKWLWATRLFKTRGLASDACRHGRVKVNGHAAKASREVRVGDLIIARIGQVTRTVRVRALEDRRVAATGVADLLEDLTPPEAFERARSSETPMPARRPLGSGRPTKRDRRRLDAWAAGG